MKIGDFEIVYLLTHMGFCCSELVFKQPYLVSWPVVIVELLITLVFIAAGINQST